MVNISLLNLRVVKESSGRYDLETKKIGSPKQAIKIFNSVLELKDRAEEILAMATLDTKNKVTGVFVVSQGSLNSSIVHPREVFKRALLQNSACIVLAHNHPSGDPNPSKEDINITTRLKEAGKMLGIEILDHIIVGEESYVSFKEKGIVV